jgi:Fe-S-cluster formation regulator IscX/YfhJ
VATRYEKLDPHYLAFVQIASLMVWLHTFCDTALPCRKVQAA